MLKEYRDEFICDLAETYGVLDYKTLPVSTLFILLKGLREDSRVIMKMSERKMPLDTELTAAMVDRLSLLVWAKTKDAQKGKNRPKSVLDIVYQKKDNMTYSSPEEFIAAREKIIRGIEDVS